VGGLPHQTDCLLGHHHGTWSSPNVGGKAKHANLRAEYLHIQSCLEPYCDVNAADAKAACCDTALMQSSHASAPSQTYALRAVLAKNMIRLRQERKWSQEHLAYEAGLHRTFVAHVERHARNISLDNLEKIALALEVEAYSLLLP